MSPAALAAYKDQETIQLFELQYPNSLKARQVKATWIEVGLGSLGWFFVIMMFVAAASGS